MGCYWDNVPSDTLSKVQEKQGLLSKIQNFFTLGYATKEDLREHDKKLRDLYYEDLFLISGLWRDILLSVINGGYKDSNSDIKKVTQVLGRLMEEVRHADYGYAGLMDRKGHIREIELARVFDYDKSVGDDIEKLAKLSKIAYDYAEENNWTETQTSIKSAKEQLLTIDELWHKRERQFRPLDL